VDDIMNDDRNPELDLVGCPECCGPAEVIDRFVLPSTDGPVEHVKLHCVRRHRFTVPVQRLPAATAPVADTPRSTPLR
jgi:hypothetical protein